MLENNSNKLMAAAAAIVVAGAIFGTVNAAYPQATNSIIEKVTSVTNAEDYAKLAYTYNESDKTAVVTGFKGNPSNKDLVIPKTTEKDGVTYKVVSIGEGAFQYTNVTSVTIPNSVTSIGDGAFYNSELTSVTIPNSVERIGQFAFSFNKLTSVTIPNSVTSISEGAFQYTKLTSVTVPNTVTSLDSRAFDPSVVINRK